ncbi:hypothetical protein GCM10008995_27530 [Halobellus salinus]|uniref:Uncharacterized protein n=1 Tax=Halobellus salinus TaxID=931585 RepID=A0A830ETG3_9EURY|nr:hypothetical protein GCM10008995_27530 [Halobellus salinus]SMP31402.1 hypothetical protein SAMN06265347_11831 [Halobellus salinus]
MSDTSGEPEARATASEAEDAASGNGSAGVGRREFVIGGGVLGVLALSGAGAYLSMGSAPKERLFMLQQGYLRYEVDPISEAGMNVEQFYDYTDPSASLEGRVNFGVSCAGRRGLGATILLSSV